MSETKLNLIKRLPKFVVVGHGAYVENPKRFVVPPDRVYIFASRASRYLPQSVVDERFYKYFGGRTTVEPPVLAGWRTRVYGPGDVFDDLILNFADPEWPGMGIQKVPLKPDVFTKGPSELSGQSGTLSTLGGPPGVYFIVACRAIQGQSVRYQNTRAEYLFAKGSTHKRIANQDAATSRLRKRRASQVTLRKVSEPEPGSKRRKINRSTRAPVGTREKKTPASTKK